MSLIPSLSRLFKNPTYKFKFLGFIDLSFSGIGMSIGTIVALIALALISNVIVYSAAVSFVVGQLFNYHIEIFNPMNMLAVWVAMMLIRND